MTVGESARGRMVFAATAVMIIVAVGAIVTRVAMADDGFATPPMDASAQALGWKGPRNSGAARILGGLNTFIIEFRGSMRVVT